jgi:hypothetical protein
LVCQKLALAGDQFDCKAPVAQLDRASVYGTEGREFESLRARQVNDLWRVLALVDLARRKQGRGAQRRRGIGNPATPGN